MKIAFIPIDNRPVCYNLPKEIAAIDSSIELLLPERPLLGGLRTYADVDGILDWLDGLSDVDAIVVSLDTLAYGGLISSRRGRQTLEQIQKRLEKFKENCQGKKVYAFSSIMRISNNNINEEEKEYWEQYGEKIFEYSYNFHKMGEETGDVPNEILSDYLATRNRNFTINKMYLEWVEQGIFDTLVFSKDDCAEFGLNVLESQILQRAIKDRKINDEKTKVFVKTGADEIPLTLLARCVCDFRKKEPKIYPKFLSEQDIYLISKYEDVSLENSAKGQIELAGAVETEEIDADLILLVNNFEEHQGEIVVGIKTKGFSGKLNLPEKPFMIADVRYANGADNMFVKALPRKYINNNFYGYAAWNTSANTFGSLICAAIIKLIAQDYNDEAFRKLQLIRFLDDWAYQANVRQILKGKQGAGNKEQKEPRPNSLKLKFHMLKYEKKLKSIFKIKGKIKYRFPWKRFFEVEITIR